MKYIDEFRDGRLAQNLAASIAATGNVASANALLKMLEEPPPAVVSVKLV